MSADILNAKKIQNALMNSPADALDIMTDGRKALGRTLEKRNGINQEMQEKIRAKLETMDGIKDLPEATRESIMASTASHLQSKIEQRGVNANENGL
ncbi:hypothetical protein IJU97_03430 [bacterium]|nr:hypothetical protein [bacterium]